MSIKRVWLCGHSTSSIDGWLEEKTAVVVVVVVAVVDIVAVDVDDAVDDDDAVGGECSNLDVW